MGVSINLKFILLYPYVEKVTVKSDPKNFKRSHLYLLIVGVGIPNIKNIHKLGSSLKEYTILTRPTKAIDRLLTRNIDSGDFCGEITLNNLDCFLDIKDIIT